MLLSENDQVISDEATIVDTMNKQRDEVSTLLRN